MGTPDTLGGTPWVRASFYLDFGRIFGAPGLPLGSPGDAIITDFVTRSALFGELLQGCVQYLLLGVNLVPN